MLFCESFCVNDFIEEYNSYKGNAYGLANTLITNCVFKTQIKSKKVKICISQDNLLFLDQEYPQH